MVRTVAATVGAALLLLMACTTPPGEGTAENSGANTSLDDTRLDLNDATGRLLASFVPARISPVGADWKAVAYNNGKQGVVNLIMDTEVTASFGTDGRVTGTAGCNQYFASYELEGQSLSIGPSGATRRLCAGPEGLMRQEALYLKALQSAATFRLDGTRLELRRADAALAVTFIRK